MIYFILITGLVYFLLYYSHLRQENSEIKLTMIPLVTVTTALTLYDINMAFAWFVWAGYAWENKRNSKQIFEAFLIYNFYGRGGIEK